MLELHQTFGWPPGLLVAFAFVFGALVGSFLNVVIARVPFGESVVWPPSHCMSCGKGIAPFHNVPIFSWFLLRGRCSNCLAPFSIRYALVELAFAVVCAFAVARHGLTLPAAREVLLMGFLIPLTAMDLEHWILPHSLTRSGAVVGLLLTLAQGRDLFLEHLLAAAVGYTGLMLVGFIGERVLKKEALGGGDPWLMALIGAFLGMRALLPVVLLSSVQGSVIGIVLILVRRRRAPEDDSEEAVAADLGIDPASAVELPAGELPAPQAPASPEPAGSEAGAPRESVEEAPATTREESSTAGPSSRELPAGEEGDGWTPDPTAIPFGPFLALAAAEVLYFTHLPRLLFPF